VADREGKTSYTTNKSLRIGLPTHYHNLEYVNFSKKDIKNSVNSNLRLYRVNSIYYYRRTINKKTYRISLKTKDLQEAKLLKNEYNLLQNEEFVNMYTNKDISEHYNIKVNTLAVLKGELETYMITLPLTAMFKTENEKQEMVKQFVYKQMQQIQAMFLNKDPFSIQVDTQNIQNIDFEKLLTIFDTIEEQLNKSIEVDKANLEKNKARAITTTQKTETIKIEKTEDIKQTITFLELQDLFLKHKEKVGKVGLSSIKMYKAALKDLMEYFQDANINELKYQDFENFQNFLIAKKLNNKTINNKITYLRMFLDYAEKFELVEKNLANKLEMLKEEVKEKENFTNDEVNLLIENAPQEFKNFLQVAMYTGMRLQEILAIDKILVDEKTQIKYIQVGDSKTTSGIRKVPLHQELLNMKFPLFNIKDGDVRTFSTNIGKRINRYIETIAKEKTIHTFRATFINKIVNNFPERIEICQEIVGHSKGNKSITLNTYSKEFDIKLKQEIVNTVQYK